MFSPLDIVCLTFKFASGSETENGCTQKRLSYFSVYIAATAPSVGQISENIYSPSYAKINIRPPVSRATAVYEFAEML